MVGGFTDPQGARVGLGALLVGYYDGDDFVFAGKVGTGFDTKLLLELRSATRRDRAAEPRRSRRRRGCRACARTGCGRRSSCRSAFIEWTVHGKLRHPRLLGVRTDKDAARRRAGDAVITHPEKVLFPGRRDHQGRAGGLLRGDRAGDAAAPARAAGHDGALSGRHRQEGLLAEGRLEGISRVAASASRCRRRTASSTIRSSPTRDRCSGSPTRTRITPHVWTSRVPDLNTPTSACSISIRPRTIRQPCAPRRSRCAICSTSWRCRAG